MPHERRLAAYASVGLFLTLFLPWYQRQFFVVISGKLQPAADSQTAWGNFTFVEAAVLLVAAGVLTLLFQRAEGKAFHLPGGDGLVITIAGFWTCALIVWRIFDKQGGTATGQHVISYGIEWGIFVALAVAASLAYAGSRIRAAHQPEPPLPGEDDPPYGGWTPPQDPGPVAPVGRVQRPAVESGQYPSRHAGGQRSFSHGGGPRSFPQGDGPQSFPQSGGPQSFPQSGGPQSFPQSGGQVPESGAEQPPRARPRPPAPDGPGRPPERSKPGQSPGTAAQPRSPGAAMQPQSPGTAAQPQSRRASSERRAGWLTAPPSHMQEPDAASPPAEWPAPEWPAPEWPAPEWPAPEWPAPERPPTEAPDPERQPPSTGGPSRPPKPVAADDSPTIRAIRNPPPPLPPSTPAAQRNSDPDDDQLTIPLERDD